MVKKLNAFSFGLCSRKLVQSFKNDNLFVWKIRLNKKYLSTKMHYSKIQRKSHVLKWFSSFSTSSSTSLFTIYRLTQLVTHTLKISQCYLPVDQEIWIQGKKFNPFLPVFSIQAISTWLHTLSKPHNIIYMYKYTWICMSIYCILV